MIAALIIGARNINEAINWASTLKGDDVAKQVEKGKGQFAGSEIAGKTLCVLGLGAIGRKVASSAHALGMNIVGYDPFISEAAKAEIPFVTIFDTMQASWADADFVTLHMPMTPETKGLVNASSISTMKDGVIIINAARGELCEVTAIKDALENKKYTNTSSIFQTKNVSELTASLQFRILEHRRKKRKTTVRLWLQRNLKTISKTAIS